MIAAWRLTRRVHARPPRDAFTGAGAERSGGRWNRIGTPAAYVSSTRSLAALEYLAHVDPQELPADLVFVGVRFAEPDVEHGEPPDGWNVLDSAVAREYGERWLRSSKVLALAVPSAIVRAERNYVVNPAHARARALAVEAELEEFIFDERLLTKR